MLLPNRFKEILAAKGRDLRQIGLDEIALSKQNAIDAIQSLERHQIAVLGGDVYCEEGGTRGGTPAKDFPSF
jgi:Immunity protein 40